MTNRSSPLHAISARSQFAALQRDRRQGANVSPAGYVTTDGNVLAAQGDEQAAFVKSVPFPSGFEAWGTAGATLPDTHASATAKLPMLDVEDWRTLTIAVEYTPGHAGSILSLVPTLQEQFTEDGAPLWPMAVVNSTIANIAVAGFSEPLLSRTLGPMELRTVGAVALLANRFTFSLDVSPAKLVTMSIAEIRGAQDAAGTLSLYYSLNV